MIRASIARHLRADAARLTPDPADLSRGSTFRAHPSFVRLPLASGDSEGACLIEPSVRCSHCGYCLSYGH